MSTYKKRESKSKLSRREKTKLEREKQELASLEKSSNTAGFFNTLDRVTQKAEYFVINNQKPIYGVILTVVIVVLIAIGYQNFILKPKEEKATNQLAYSRVYYEQANNYNTNSDSLYTLALNGINGNYGFIDISEQFSGTKAGNLASYYAGMSYLKLNKYPEAIKYLEKFKSTDLLLGPIAYAAIGDAFADIDQDKDALSFYQRAADDKINDLTTPIFLQKAGQTAIRLGENKKALKFFERLKNNFPDSHQAKSIDVYIGMAKYAEN